MKNVIIIILVILSIVGILFLCANLYYKKLGNNYNKTPFFDLNTNAGIPFEWRCNIEDESIISIKRVTINLASDKLAAGGPLVLRNYVTGLKKGNTKVTCDFVYIGGNDEIDKTRIFDIKVDSDLNVVINEEA